MNEQELRDRLHLLAGTVDPPENPLPTLYYRRRKKRKSAGVLLAVVAVIALVSFRQTLENTLREETGMEPSVASAPLRSGVMMPPRVGVLNLLAMQGSETPTTSNEVNHQYAVKSADLIRVAVRCKTPQSTAQLVVRAADYLDQQTDLPCSASGDAVDVPVTKLWKLPVNRETVVFVAVILTSTYGGGTPFAPEAAVTTGLYRG